MSLFQRLRDGLSRSSKSLGSGLGSLLGGGRLSAERLDELEEVLIGADLGVQAAADITARMKAYKGLGGLDDAGLRRALADEITALLAPVSAPFSLPAARPTIILMAGVNGAGKTTTIGKLAQRFQAEGKTVMLAACDTFRAAAGEQLAIWGERANVPVVSGAPGTDAAGLAFEAVQKAQAENIDVLLVDTAGRLQNNDGLMAELEKIIRVMRKLVPEAPHASLLVLDATVGQNAVRQAEVFLEKAAITGLIVTKLDGTARGGGLVPVAMKLNLPVYFIGVGEQAEDLQTFNAAEFAAALTGADMAQSEKEA
jgi:fused signal recognition particle receptor